MISARKLNTYTYKDYQDFFDDMRCEIIEGEVVMMSPAPSAYHQDIAGKLYLMIANQLKGKKCRPYISPIDVFFDYEENKNNVDDISVIVQPDILVVCDKNKIDKRGILGSPDLVIEVLSPSTSRMDWNTKYELYQKYGVKEYWIVSPDGKFIQLNYLVEGVYQEVLYTLDDKKSNILESKLLEGLKIDLSDVFDDNYFD